MYIILPCVNEDSCVDMVNMINVGYVVVLMGGRECIIKKYINGRV